MVEEVRVEHHPVDRRQSTKVAFQLVLRAVARPVQEIGRRGDEGESAPAREHGPTRAQRLPQLVIRERVQSLASGVIRPCPGMCQPRALRVSFAELAPQRAGSCRWGVLHLRGQVLANGPHANC